MKRNFPRHSYGHRTPLKRSLNTNSVADIAKAIRTGSYGTQVPVADKPYSQVGVVYACVKAKADALSSMPMMVSRSDDTIVETGPLADLTTRPNPKMTQRSFMRAASAFLDLFGCAYWLLDVDAIGRPLAVTPLSPLNLKPEIHKVTGELVGWWLQLPVAGQREFITPDLVHPIIDPDFSSTNPLDGLSPSRAANIAIQQHYKADLANSMSLQTGSGGGYAVKLPGTPSDDQVTDMREQLKERHQGFNRDRWMILHDGAEVEPLFSSFSEMEFSKLKAMSRTDICAAYSVPPAVIGYYEDSNYSHTDAADRIFWKKTILPRASWLAEEWTTGILSRFRNDRSLSAAESRASRPDLVQVKSPGFKAGQRAAQRSSFTHWAWFDTSQVDVMQQQALDQVKTVKEWVAMGVPLNDALRATDAPFPEVPWGNTWHKPMGLVDVQEDALDTIDDPDGSNPAEATGDATRHARGQGDDAMMTRAGEKLRRHIWLSWRTSWRPLEKQVFTTIKQHFYELRAETLQRLNDAMRDTVRAASPDTRRDMLGVILFDLTAAKGKLAAKVSGLIRTAFMLGGSQSMVEAADASGQGEASAFLIDNPDVAAKMRGRVVKLTSVDETLQRLVAERVADALSKQQTVDEIAETIRQEFNFASTRAKTIARTETAAAVEEARHEGRRQAGVPLKSWLWSAKETGRPSHQRTESETIAAPIANEAEFQIAGTGARCLHPRGTNDPAHDINCGCTTLSRFPNDNIKAVLSYYATRGFMTLDQALQRGIITADTNKDE